mmetsp:Transcript_6065/g.15395  ORF Transcript_6065/g.15395 Transcript_6065/m.15395 type:complete len:344 (-) Transcript_6065:25-1056(-)|eukprot:CAMPEP_0177666194 /NCGR_PEP_ID=MMETSP0447-20121125/21453_1 /TAXON_ID=0 /ORGANISM="Stygamoeba regulata, Strain BSH-02190019" /LENGTH=343 /DNA_ID=CAMNT_0019172329 /DNA_START=120 /DNA_END=1151 /DNA_ORIENTATION=+
MGGCAGKESVVSTEEHKEIERQIISDKKKAKTLQRLLILGAGESGKTTLCKQFQICNDLFTEEDREKYGVALRASLVQYMKILLQAAEHMQFPIKHKKEAKELLEFQSTLNPESADLIHTLWSEEGVQMAFATRNRLFTLPDTCEELFNRVRDIANPNYKPTDDDCLRVRLRTVGITEYHLVLKDQTLVVVDVGGQRNARRKWINCFDAVSCLLYCIALDDYSMVTAEDLTTNRLFESLKLFKDVLSIQALTSIPLIIFFNKIDLLQEKIKIHPLEALFSNYKCGKDSKAALEFIRSQYLSCIPPWRNYYPHVTNALDSRNIKKVFDAVYQLLFNAALEDGGF